MRVDELPGGGAPLLGEPLPIELANTTHAVRGRLLDGLDTAEHLAAWLRDTRARLSEPVPDHALLALGPAELEAARQLRDAVRQLAAAAAHRTRPPQQALDTVNQRIRAAPRWRELSWDAEAPAAVPRSSGSPVGTALAELAQQAVDLFSGPELPLVTACQGPGCVLHFVKDSPRRGWCSPACGNRARAARHYARTKQAG
ncbi:CGNR zinc finger domain-containing protein [Kitasatospora sp. NPDC051853]|uniref:CGNR zinc finger domain-containing protein n=1 Tax=Kitasatospora sp. NPDC051853 TaxID=3364058 RepID=UPI00378758AD